MATESALASNLAANCCNGRVGREMVELAQQRGDVARIIEPTGVSLIKATGEAGIAAELASNCCNGRVGRNMAEEIMAAFGGG